jgi:hypothetical protein
MRFEKFSEKIVDQATTKLLQGEPITDTERLNVIRYLATAAKADKDLKNWHYLLTMIERYEYIVDMNKIYEILIRLIPKLGFFEEKTD